MSTPAFGKYLKELRIRKGVTLREHCQATGLDPGNYSRLERGRYLPPQKHEILERYAAALDIKEGSEEWMEFFDLAAASRGELPKDLLDDAELVEKLPVLFRALRANSVSEEKLDAQAAEIERLKAALGGAWLEYHAIPWQISTAEYDAMDSAEILVPLVQPSPRDSGAVVAVKVYRMQSEDIEAVLRGVAQNHNVAESGGPGEQPVHGILCLE